jgi:hypothetical protein
VKIITKPVIWKNTENPFVDTLTCPICDKASVLLDPAFVLTDGPQQLHVNLSKVEGKMLTMRGTCKDCKAAFLLRILLHAGGTYTWHDIGVPAKTWNALLAEESPNQLPCMCRKCQLKGEVMPASDESTLSAKEKALLEKFKKAAHEPAPKVPDEPILDADIVDTKIVPVIHQQGYALTMGQHRAIAKAMKANWAKLAQDTGLSVQDTQLHFVNVIEAYVRIKFATFQPSANDDPNLPPQFPTVVPKAIFATFTQSGEDHLCEYLVTSFALVDQVLGRPDLPASVIYHHMCRMCKLTDCQFHPSQRKEG